MNLKEEQQFLSELFLNVGAGFFVTLFLYAAATSSPDKLYVACLFVATVISCLIALRFRELSKR